MTLPVQSEIMDKLKASPEYPKILAALQALPEWDDAESLWLGTVLHRALSGPLPHERLTKTERTKIADRITALSMELAQLLYRVHGDKELGRDWPGELQAQVDYMALRAAVDYKESVGAPEESELGEALSDVHGTGFHIARYAIYHTLIDCMPEALETIAQGSQMWKEFASDPPLAKPNHKNADRLYFIRRMTSHFVRSYGRPLREVTLGLASIYFDCDDLEVAALSNLAPVNPKHKKLYESRKSAMKTKLSEGRS